MRGTGHRRWLEAELLKTTLGGANHGGRAENRVEAETLGFIRFFPTALLNVLPDICCGIGLANSI
jgi:hypothetical protein